MIEHPFRTEDGCAMPPPILMLTPFIKKDIQVARNDMCRTKHRSEEQAACTEAPMKFEDGRCTSHLDLCYPADPCCRPCAQCESSPCEGRIDTSDDGHSDDKDWDPEDLEGLKVIFAKEDDNGDSLNKDVETMIKDALPNAPVTVEIDVAEKAHSAAPAPSAITTK